MKIKADNIVLIMSAGIGSRFGGMGVPKQYCLMNGRPIIEYALDACRLSHNTDEIIIVTSEKYFKEIYDRYGFPTTIGGKTRTESLANGLAYIDKYYECKKVIIANAVCPLMMEEQIDRYFDLLDEFDYVLTSWKVVSTLHRYDGKNVNRDDFFHVMEPEAYRFRMLFENYSKDFPVPYIFHQMPEDSRAFWCFDYPYTMKITYADDVEIATILYNNKISKPKIEKTRQNINLWLSSYDCSDVIAQWLLKIPEYMIELINRWGIINYTINPQTQATCVFEAYSIQYGEVIVKFHAPAPSGRFDLELLYYRSVPSGIMAELLDYDEEYQVLLIKKISPGMQTKFDSKNLVLKEFYANLEHAFIPAETISKNIEIPTIMKEFEFRIRRSNQYNFELKFKQKMESVAKEIWKDFFEDSQKYFLHRDLHYRNLLRGKRGIVAIDPLGEIGPKEFEYVIPFVVELKKYPVSSIRKKYFEMLLYFSKYCEEERLYFAIFILWVYKMDEYIFVKHDNFRQAKWLADAIKLIFFENVNWENESTESLKEYLKKYSSQNIKESFEIWSLK